MPLAVVTTTWRRRDLLVLALIGQIVTNGLTALSHDIVLTLAVRFAAGLSSGLIWSLLGAYAARIAPDGKQGRAISIALGGIPVSLALGIPAGVLIEHVANWQTAFWASTLLAAVTIFWVLVTLPNLSGIPQGERHSIPQVLALPGIKTILTVVACFVIAHNILYTYVAQFLDDHHLGGQTGQILLVFGVMAVVSILVVGSQIDRHLRATIVASTVLFSLSAFTLALFAGSTVLVYVAAAGWGLAFGSSATLFTTAIVVAADDAGDVAQSAMISVFSGSIAAGGLIGGLLLGAIGTQALVDVSFVLVVVSAVVSYLAKRYAFPKAVHPRH